MSHREIIKSSREALNLSHIEVAEFIDISAAWCWDLESYEDELFMTMDISHVIKLCRLLKITPRYLLSCPPSESIRQPEELKQLIVTYCQETSTRIEDFEEKAGWEVGSFLADPRHQFQTWSLYGLKDVCSVLGASYMEFLPA